MAIGGACAGPPAPGVTNGIDLDLVQEGLDRDYLVFVASEATDEVQLVRFGPSDGVMKATVERRHSVGFHPTDPDGPHGVAVSSDDRFYYVSTAHGVPNGYLWKFSAEDSRPAGHVQLGLFPASVQVSPDGLYAYVVNFNLHGDMVPSSVSIVSTAEMLEVARLRTCVMPHGSTLSPDGARHYSTCMMDDLLIEIDARGFAVSRHFMLTPGGEQGISGAPEAHGAGMPTDGGARCSPTWAAPSADGTRVYVACNQANDIVEIDTSTWTLVRRIPAGEGVYNLALVPIAMGPLVIATNRRGRSVSLIDGRRGLELTRVETLRPIVHGVVTSDDFRYAFISVEGIGAEPGTVEMFDLRNFRRVAAVDVGQMSGGIAFWRSEPAR